MDKYLNKETELNKQFKKLLSVSRLGRPRPRRCQAIGYQQRWKDKQIKREKEKSRNFSEEQTEEYQSFELSNYQWEGQEDSIQLFGGLQIKRDGGVRLIPGLNHITFGYNLGTISKVEFLISSGLVNIQQSLIENAQQLSELPYEQGLHFTQEALRILDAYPDEYNQEIAKQVGQCDYALVKLEDSQPPAVPKFFRNNYKEEKDIEFQTFITFSFEVLKTLSKSEMYSYNIGRINPLTEEMEFFHSGYSQEYLALIGIDTDVLASLLFRKKKVELLLNNNDFNKLSANALKWMETCQPFSTDNQYEFDQYKKFNQQNVSYFSEPVSSQIITFDGFKLTLNQRLRVIYMPFYYLIQEEMICDCSCGYFLQIFEFDVGLSELEQLITYRQRLYSQSNSLSMQDFLSRELSLMFEDVEYSVRSTEFLEKYYSQSLPQLINLKKQKDQQQELDNLRCKYRKINL